MTPEEIRTLRNIDRKLGLTTQHVSVNPEGSLMRCQLEHKRLQIPQLTEWKGDLGGNIFEGEELRELAEDG